MKGLQKAEKQRFEKRLEDMQRAMQAGKVRRDMLNTIHDETVKVGIEHNTESQIFVQDQFLRVLLVIRVDM